MHAWCGRRMFDVAGAAAGLAVFAPAMALVAIGGTDR